ncbi:MAG: hypothetical protein IPH80_02730 [Myxococcales bacterium]|nr:hypothetical protein [Myxococcales bacterium]MBP6849677.1 hypothetical protein [Kofleriaceae bacterium]
MFVPDDAPPFALYCAPYGGLGLRARSFRAARARIDGLLAGAAEVVQTTAELSVFEPAGRALVEDLLGRPIERDTAYAGSGRATLDTTGAVRRADHAHDALAAEAWQRFGAPHTSGARQHRGVFHVEWRWLVEDAAAAAAALDAWSPFVEAHDREMLDDFATRVGVRAIWAARLRVASGLVAAPFPPSSIHAHLRGKHASAFLDLVLPHVAATPAFDADYAAVNQALGITVPRGGYKLNAPKKRGTGRVYKRLPPG